LGNGTLHGNLLCKLCEHRDELVCRDAGPAMACKGAEEWIVPNRALPLTLQVGIRRKLAHAGLSGTGLSGVMTELSRAVVCARLPEARAHLRPRRRLKSRKRKAQALRGIL
jgi:hypothetical protein